MANKNDTAAKHWALLVGINYYMYDRCLEGAVRDVKEIKKYLDERPTPVEVIMLTATAPEDTDSKRPQETPEDWPTSSNFSSALKRLLTEAKEGHFVYIHYSGHGTRTESPLPPPHAGPSELSLLLFHENGSSNFRGRHLATAVKKLVDTGVIVTLVLDGCFSGSAVRGPPHRHGQVRSTDYNPDFDEPAPWETDPSLLEEPDDGSRNARMASDRWLVRPDGYTILAACGPNEEAWELETGNGERRGALSYFLVEAVKALSARDRQITFQSLYQLIRVKFHAYWPRQVPMRYGNRRGAEFFGCFGVAQSETFVSVFRTADDGLSLSAGKAHGVYEGDEYAVYPVDSPATRRRGAVEGAAKARVGQVSFLTSELTQIASGSDLAPRIETGWEATLVSSMAADKISVGIGSKLTADLSYLKAAASRSPFFQLFDVEDENIEGVNMFTITLNERKEYEVLDACCKTIPTLPKIPQQSEGALEAVTEMVEHISAFTFIQGIEIEERDFDFEKSFSLSATGKYAGSGPIEIIDDQSWELLFQNFSNGTLYLSILSFSTLWEIANVASDIGQNDVQPVPPKSDLDSGIAEMTITMTVPDEMRQLRKTECEDIVRVFVTSQATSFFCMELPKMPLRAEDLLEAVNIRQREEKEKKKSDMVERMNTGLEREHRANVEHWACKDFIIRTTIPAAAVSSDSP